MCKLTIFILSFACFVASAEAVPTYRIQDLGDLRGGQDQSFAVDINNAGWIVGEVGAPGGPRAAVWKRKSNGTYKLINLGVNRGHNSSLANSINASNTVVGRSSAIGDEFSSEGVRWVLASNGKYVARGLGALECDLFSWRWTEAYAINDAGSIVGLDDSCSFIWKRGAGMKVLFQPDDIELGLEILTDINNGGLAVGTRHGPACCGPLPIIWNTESESVNALPLDDIGYKGYAEGINSKGYVVGQAGDHFIGCCDTEAVLWSPDKNGGYTAKVIGPPTHSPNAFTNAATGHDINRHNQVVGGVSITDGTDGTPGKSYAFYWSKGSGFLDLNKLVARKDRPRGKLLSASAINDRGLIVGRRLTKGGKYHAFLLTPQ